MLFGYLNACEGQIKDSSNGIFNAVLETIKKTDFFSKENGTYELHGKDLYYHLLSYETKEKTAQTSLEMHKQYIDFFYILSGKETIYYVPNNGSYDFSSNYDLDKDVEFIKDLTEMSSLIFEKGMFAVFFPGELHLSGFNAGGLQQIRKVIFKVKFN